MVCNHGNKKGCHLETHIIKINRPSRKHKHVIPLGAMEGYELFDVKVRDAEGKDVYTSIGLKPGQNLLSRVRETKLRFGGRN